MNKNDTVMGSYRIPVIPCTIPPEVIAKSVEIMSACFNIMNHWPDDFWVSITNEWDLNLWLDEQVLGATLYHVDKNGQTQSDIFYRIFHYQWEGDDGD